MPIMAAPGRKVSRFVMNPSVVCSRESRRKGGYAGKQKYSSWHCGGQRRLLRNPRACFACGQVLRRHHFSTAGQGSTGLPGARWLPGRLPAQSRASAGFAPRWRQASLPLSRQNLAGTPAGRLARPGRYRTGPFKLASLKTINSGQRAACLRVVKLRCGASTMLQKQRARSCSNMVAQGAAEQLPSTCNKGLSNAWALGMNITAMTMAATVMLISVATLPTCRQSQGSAAE